MKNIQSFKKFFENYQMHGLFMNENLTGGEVETLKSTKEFNDFMALLEKENPTVEELEMSGLKFLIKYMEILPNRIYAGLKKDGSGKAMSKALEIAAREPGLQEKIYETLYNELQEDTEGNLLEEMARLESKYDVFAGWGEWLKTKDEEGFDEWESTVMSIYSGE